MRITSSSGMTLAGEKKCRPMTSCGRLVASAIAAMSSVEVLVASTAPGLASAPSVAKILRLSSRFSNTASMITSASPERVVERAWISPCAALLVGRRDAAALDHRVVGVRDRAQPALERLAAAIDQRHRQSGVGEADRDAAAHGAGADDRGRAHRPPAQLGRQPGNLARLAFGKEQVHQCLGFHRHLGAIAQFGLVFEALLERQARGGEHRVDRGQAAVRCGYWLRPARGASIAACAAGYRALGGARGPALLEAPARTRSRRRAVAFDLASRKQLSARTYRSRVEDQLERVLDADEPRHALRATRAGDDAQRHFRQAETGARHATR